MRSERQKLVNTVTCAGSAGAVSIVIVLSLDLDIVTAFLIGSLVGYAGVQCAKAWNGE